jgi:thymidylate synthase (FAD)
MGSDLTVANAARVSFGKKSEPTCGGGVNERDAKLIRYLAKHRHITPFGHCFVSFHIKAPIFVRGQLAKHQYLRINEISRRYVSDDPEFYMPETWRGRAEDVKQGSGAVCQSQYFPTVYAEEVCSKALGDYRKMLQQGVAPEMARMILPQSMYTEWYWSGSLDAMANMVNLRDKPDAQYESRIVAQQISKKMKLLYPVSWEALTNE